jgi:hypothetical protein
LTHAGAGRDREYMKFVFAGGLAEDGNPSGQLSSAMTTS